MLGIVFATPSEARPFVEQRIVEQRTGGRLDSLEEGQHVRSNELLVVATGPGKIKATLETERLLRQHEVDVLVHAGGAAALGDAVEPGTLVGATFVLEGDRVALDDPAYPRMPLAVLSRLSGEGTLVTQDHTDDENAEAQSYWERIADMRDSTGYAVAYVAAQHGVPCHIVKGITHRTGEEPHPPVLEETYGAVATFLQEQVDENEIDS